MPINRFGDFRASIDRVAAAIGKRPVKYVLGAHIEMTTTPGKDLPDGARSHPDEHVLELPWKDWLDLQAAVDGMGDKVARFVAPDFIVSPAPPR